jgi:wyosine [tRNA(Phe)-imidazoG37] synthetase (radical SAM superfamily)
MKFKYIYGPVNSRRFGKSLGIDLLPFKTCNFNCVFCQLGRTKKLVNERREYVPFEEVIKELKIAVNKFLPDVLTFSGSGEPLLYSRLGEMIREIKKLFPDIKLSLLTHAPFIEKEEIRKELYGLDVFCPSLDAGTESTFLKIARPHREIKFKNILMGLLRMREEFRGEYHLEIMYIEGLNDNKEDIEGLREFVKKINPHRIYINTPLRPPAEKWVKFPDYKKVLEFANKISDKAEVVYSLEREREEEKELLDIFDSIKRRPYSFDEIKKMTKIEEEKLKEELEKEVKKGNLRREIREGKEFYYYRKE